MFRFRQILTVMLAIILLTVSSTQSHAQSPKMYWTDPGNGLIQRANQDGSSVETLLTVGAPVAIALDTAGGKMYWSDNVTDKIQRANLDGTGVQDLVSGLSDPLGIALDVSGGKMYYIVESSGIIQRANLDGTGVETLVVGFGDPRYIALDLISSKMYWSDAATDTIQRANLDGTGVENVLSGLTGPYGIALDQAAGKIYWTDTSIGQVQRANLDGTNVEILVTGDIGPGIALDTTNGKIYYFTGSPQILQRANLDGTSAEDIVTGLSVPHGIALDTTPTTMQFASFTPKVELEFGSGAYDDEFEVNARLTLGTGSDGIGPLMEDVKIQVGTYTTTIPAGSFHQDKKGRFKYEGTINGVALEVAIRPLGGNSYEFKAEGENANLSGTTNPVTISITIGDDTGDATVTAEFG